MVCFSFVACLINRHSTSYRFSSFCRDVLPAVPRDAMQLHCWLGGTICKQIELPPNLALHHGNCK